MAIANDQTFPISATRVPSLVFELAPGTLCQFAASLNPTQAMKKGPHIFWR